MHRIETQFAGRPLIIETGRLAKQAAGSASLRFGDTWSSPPSPSPPTSRPSRSSRSPSSTARRPTPPARFPGGFIKREGRPSDKEILAGRLIDRSIRPLFPEGFKNEVQVFVTVLSADQENDADVLGVVAASAGAEPVDGPVERPARRGAGGPGRGQLDPQPDLPAARILHHRPRRERLRRLDRHGRGRRARGLRGRGARGAQGGAEGHQAS